MIKVQNSIATREPIPANIVGLSDDTLSHLQSALSPVPDDLIGCEWWPEISEIPDYDPDTHRLGAETLTPMPDEHYVRVTYAVEPLSAEEIAARNPVPESVTALQGILAIDAAGLVSAFTAWKASLDPMVDFAILAFFDKAQTWRRDNQYLLQGATALGLSDEQIDDLFRLAVTL